MNPKLRAFRESDTPEVVALWELCELTRPWNDPRKDIVRKLTVQPELFRVAVQGSRIIGTIMAGFDGHRGWVNYLAVHPDERHRGLGRDLMNDVERRLLALGCPKVNLQVRTTNTAALAFYEAIGYGRDDAVSLGKRIIPDA
ncbi:MAG: GNAT family acetyltransferase [Burkholderiaceae bacterium]